jgi:hypothetical protein
VDRPSARAVLAVVAVGVLVRLGLVAAAPRWGYPWDHFDQVGMGLAAARHGVLNVYTLDAASFPVVPGWVVSDGVPARVARTFARPPNYPPLGVVLLWLQALLLERMVVPLQMNTFAARVGCAVLPAVAEVVTALGVARLVRLAGGGTRAAWRAGAVAWLFPPVLMNGWFWGQTDTLVLPLGVATVLAAGRGRWWAAGAWLVVAALVKPQGALLAAVVAFAAIAGRPPRWRHLGATVASAVATTLVATAPWLATGGTAWVQHAYVENVGLFSAATLHAFNAWYPAVLAHGGAPVDATTVAGGLTFDAWGRLLLLAAGVGAAVVCARLRRTTLEATTVFAALWLWSAFVWPTRVHERYMLYAVPFVVATAALRPSFRPCAAGLAVVGVAEHAWSLWEPASHPVAAALLTATSIGSYGWAMVAASSGPARV